MAEDLAHLLDHLGVHQAALAGLSMGGYVALRFAERWPQRVRGLALCDTRSEADGNSARAARAATMNLVAEQGMEAFLETFLPTVFAPETWTDQPGVIDEARRILRSHSPTTVRRGLMAITSRSDTTEALGTFPFPVTCIVGEKDTLTPPALSEAMARRAPRGRLEIIPTAGHMSCLENPQAFNEALARWLDEVDASEPPLPS
jgi:pimeloyl-ACP methyl ester carboxylesterase